MKLIGTYSDDNELEYVCRVIPYNGNYYSPVNHKLNISHGDVLYMLGNGTWFALYQTSDKRKDALKILENPPQF